MIKKTFFVVGFVFLLTSSLSPMNRNIKDFKSINAITFVTENILAIGSDNGCFLIYNPIKSQPTIICLHTTATNHLITDKKSRLGVLSPEIFTVYDVHTRQQLFLQNIYNDPHYSASFSNVDNRMFVSQCGKLYSDKKEMGELPHLRSHNDLHIVCHPQKNELLYLFSNNTLGIKDLDTKEIIKLHPQLSEHKIICRAYYNDSGSCIGIYTDSNQFYIYYPAKKLTQKCTAPSCTALFNSMTFISKPKPGIAFLCSDPYIHYRNLTNSEDTHHTLFKSYTNLHDKNNAQLSFSPQSTYFATNINGLHIGYNYIIYSYHTIFKYWALKENSHKNNNYFPQELIKIITQLVHDLFPFYID